MAEPWTFTFEPLEQVFTFSNGHVTFAVNTDFGFPTPPAVPSVTVESVSLTIPHDTTVVDLGITNVEIPAPVVEHVAPHFDLLI
jgi:hypothetical protein